LSLLADLHSLTVPPPEPGKADWNDEGVVVLPGFFTAAELEPYMSEWQTVNGFRGVTRLTRWERNRDLDILDADRHGGWPDCTPYMRHSALRALLCEPQLGGVLEALIGEPAAVHLNLTGWVSTQRDWHQDSYLNPPHVGDFYAAVWIALGDIDPRSGPFQYVPSSHRWPQVTRDSVGNLVDLKDPRWPKHSEPILSPLFEQDIADRNAEVVTYLPKKGDVLIWHGRLLHRGSKPQANGAYRPALIAHYSGIEHRRDFPAPAVQHESGGWFFPISGGPV
jgi:ectoine hydroxylase-related dioxygenase (phytanoyl-CoA dioxygenase family)